MESPITFIKQNYEAYELKIHNKYKPDELLLHDLIIFDLTDTNKEGLLIDDSENRAELTSNIDKDLIALVEEDWTTEKISSITLEHCRQLISLFQIYRIYPPLNSIGS